ncbi:MAG: rod shape-determining protein RodA [Chitinispirillaceae bacterium]|nr:rod shape-determining protein RodA [Chitinispirillaceae bacterium]
MIEERRFGKFDFPLLWAAIALWIVGILLIYSATYTAESGPLAGLYKQQVVWVALALATIGAIISIPGRFFFGFGYVFYGLALCLLLLAEIMGASAKGAERWIIIAGFKLQPSEFAKIGVLLALARYLSEHTVSLERPASLLVPAALVGVPFVLVLKQPDLGTAMVFCAMSIPLLYWSGLKLIEVFYLVSPGVSLLLSAIPLIMSFSSGNNWGFTGAVPWGFFFLVLVAVLYLTRPHLFLMIAVVAANLFTATIITVVWRLLKDYQKMRIISFIDPQQDPFGAGYQVIQSKVAIGSGALFGKGFLQGTQTKLSFLPEQHTDFIFSVLGEQFGLIGGIVVLGLLFFLVVRGIIITHTVRNRFFNLIIVGGVSIIAVHIFINIAMTLGMMPVVGIPLPFLSYGGSFTLTLAILVGLILNAKKSD